jgi:hypothetical protein
MKNKIRIFSFIVLIILVLLLITADGMVHVEEQSVWSMARENSQLAAINYEDGKEDLILSVGLTQELKGDRAVWIFPVPSKAKDVEINILKSIPAFSGTDMERSVKDYAAGSLAIMSATQIYPLPALIGYLGVFSPSRYINTADTVQGGAEVDSMWKGIDLYERVEKNGLVTELFEFDDAQAFERFLENRNLTLDGTAKSILESYIDKDYSFVVSWIININAFNEEKISLRQQYGYNYNSMQASVMSVFIRFPTEKIFYPLEPTAVYGSVYIPTNIYVVGHVKPELYAEIEGKTTVTYYKGNSYLVPEELRSFFRDKNRISNLDYTKIYIGTTAADFADDLWMEKSVPSVAKIYNLTSNYGVLTWVVAFILFSCIASLVSGLIIFRKDSPSIWKFILFGFSNFLSLIGFCALSFVFKIDKNFTKTAKNKVEDVQIKKVIFRTLLIAAIPIVIVFFIVLLFFGFILLSVGHYGNYYGAGEILLGLFYTALISGFSLITGYIFSLIFFAPFVYGYYKNRKIMKFDILFSALFMILSILYYFIMVGPI